MNDHDNLGRWSFSVVGLNGLSEFGICTVGNGSFKMRDLIKVGILGRNVVERQNKEDKLGREYLTTIKNDDQPT